MCTRFYVGGLSPSVTKDDLQKLFSKLAPVEDVHVPNTVVPALSRPFMIVKLKSEADGKAIAAVSKLNGSAWKGGKLRVEKAKPFFKERLEDEKRTEREKEMTMATNPKQSIPKYNKKAPAVLVSLLPASERASLPPRPSFFRIRRARSVPAFRVAEPVLLVNGQTFKKVSAKVDDRTKFAKHIIFDEEKMQQLLSEFEPYTAPIKPIATTSKTLTDKAKKAKKATVIEGDAIEIVKKPVIGGGQRKGFGTLLAAAATTTTSIDNGSSSLKSGKSAGANVRLHQISENEMDLDDEIDDDDMVRRFPMPQTNIEYANADLSTGKTKILSEEEILAEHQRMLAIAMMDLIPPQPTPSPKKLAVDKKLNVSAITKEADNVVSAVGRKRSLSDLNKQQEKLTLLVSIENEAQTSKQVKFRTEGLEEIREIPSRQDLKPSFMPSRLDDAVRNIFGSQPTPSSKTEVPQELKAGDLSSTVGSAENIMPSGYADMSTLKSIFDSGEQGGIWWDDNVGKAIVSAAEERGQGFQNDEIFRAAEKYGIDVRMFDFSQSAAASTADLATANSVFATLPGKLSMTSGNNAKPNETIPDSTTTLVFDFFGDGASVSTQTQSSSSLAATEKPPSLALSSNSTSKSATLLPSSLSSDPSRLIVAQALPPTTYFREHFLSTLLPNAKRFHRDRSDEEMQREWERNKQRIFAIVSKKAKVAKNQAFVSSKSSFKKSNSADGKNEGSSKKKSRFTRK